MFAEETVNSIGQRQPELTAQLFNPSYDKDWFENTALTVRGNIGPLKALYAGAYLVRNIEQVQDYTNYNRDSPYADYYQCIPGPVPAARCLPPRFLADATSASSLTPSTAKPRASGADGLMRAWAG